MNVFLNSQRKYASQIPSCNIILLYHVPSVTLEKNNFIWNRKLYENYPLDLDTLRMVYVAVAVNPIFTIIYLFQFGQSSNIV